MRRGAAMALLAALALAGCGSKPLSSGELHTRATRACTLATRLTDRIRTPASPAASKVFLKQGIAALAPTLAQLRRLRPPSEVADVYSASVGAFATKLAYLRTAEHDIARGQDPVVAMRTLEQRIGPVVSQENGGWQALEIPACINQ